MEILSYSTLKQLSVRWAIFSSIVITLLFLHKVEDHWVSTSLGKCQSCSYSPQILKLALTSNIYFSIQTVDWMAVVSVKRHKDISLQKALIGNSFIYTHTQLILHLGIMRFFKGSLFRGWLIWAHFRVLNVPHPRIISNLRFP
jgi:hypothetical protein